jgi:hypothetical protein
MCNKFAEPRSGEQLAQGSFCHRLGVIFGVSGFMTMVSVRRSGPQAFSMTASYVAEVTLRPARSRSVLRTISAAHTPRLSVRGRVAYNKPVASKGRAARIRGGVQDLDQPDHAAVAGMHLDHRRGGAP